MNLYKKHFFILTFLLIVFTVTAQDRRPNVDKIKSLKIAFITDNLDLTTKEATQFWPIYNLYDERLRKLKMDDKMHLRANIRTKKGIDNLSEKDAKKLVETRMEYHKEIYETELKMIKELSKVISQKKIIKLQLAENEFRRKLIGKLRHRGRD